MAENNMGRRLQSMQAFMEVAKYLDESPQHVIPILLGASENEIQELKDSHRLWRKMVAHLLNSIVLEITVKVIWELDNNAACPHTHNIRRLYGELEDKSQQELKQIYDDKAALLAGLGGNDKKGRSIRLGELVQLQSLHEALEANEDTIKNFKYDTEFKGKSSAMGSIIWEGDIGWTLPPLSQRIPEALYCYAKNRLQVADQSEE